MDFLLADSWQDCRALLRGGQHDFYQAVFQKRYRKTINYQWKECQTGHVREARSAEIIAVDIPLGYLREIESVSGEKEDEEDYL